MPGLDRDLYWKRRNVLCDGLNSVGWQVEKPRGTMFVWAPIPEPYRHLGSLEFSKKLLLEAKVAVSPGIGFGEYGNNHVRFALIENEHRTRQAIQGIRDMFRKDNRQGMENSTSCKVIGPLVRDRLLSPGP
jgi:alanine-synthesizing transaminase